MLPPSPTLADVFSQPAARSLGTSHMFACWPLDRVTRLQPTVLTGASSEMAGMTIRLGSSGTNPTGAGVGLTGTTVGRDVGSEVGSGVGSKVAETSGDGVGSI